MRDLIKNAVIRLTPEQRQAVDPCGCYRGAPYCDIILNVAQEQNIAASFIDKLRISPDTHRNIWLSLCKGELYNVPTFLLSLRSNIQKLILENTSMNIIDVSPPVLITSYLCFRYEISNLDEPIQKKYLDEIRLIMDTNPSFRQFLNTWGIRQVIPQFEGSSNILVIRVA